MACVGKIGEFEESKENFECYVERLEQYFEANEVADGKKVPIFLTVVGASTYGLLKSLLTPDLPRTKTYDELVTVLSSYFTPQPLVIAERFKFHRYEQKDGESVANFVMTLKKLATHCDFGQFLNQALRDRFVCGLKDETIQKKLLTETDLTIQHAVEIAQAMELAARNAQEFKTASTTVNKVSHFRREKGKRQNGDKASSSGKKGGPESVSKGNTACFRCSGKHSPDWCKFKHEQCYECSQKGHISKCCPKKPKPSVATKFVDLDSDMEQLGLYSVYTSVVKDGAYKLNLVGQIQVPVKYGDQRENLPVVVVKGDKSALFGRNWLERIKLNWSSVFSVVKDERVDQLIKKFPSVFKEGYGTIQGFKADIRLKENTQPISCKPRPVPYARRDAVSDELDRLEANGIISKVDHSKWATPVVVVPKSDKTIRLCGDYKVTVNKSVEAQQYPLPNAEDIFATLAGGTVFTKLDLTHAYQQLELEPQAEELLTINTHRGLYRYHRLAFGVAPAPAIFQSVMEQILQGLDGVKCRLDDILLSSKVLERLEKYHVRLRFDKCQFFQTGVDYLGHRVDKDGLHSLPEKVSAIIEAPAPTTVTELRAFLGMVNYYGKFLDNLSTVLHPLHELLQKDMPWAWTSQCDEAFQECKRKLSSNQLLVHYDLSKPLKLACDASAYGVGAVISHVMENGEERPIAYASCTLTSAARNYSQLEKEALSIIFGVKRFHQYLYGRNFILETDHQPLTVILGPKRAVPTLAAARLQRWALILSAYQYDIVYRKSADHSNADALSRCPVADTRTSEDTDVFYCSHLDELPVTSKDISEATRKDPVLSRVWEYTINGWPNHVTTDALQPYFVRRNQLSTDQGCVLWGLRVIVPPKFRDRLLEGLHEVHPGMCRMKSLARSYLWWPGLDKDIEDKVRSCSICQSVRKTPPVAPLQPWQWPKRVWQRIHIDYAEYEKQHFLIVVDSHSKWLEVFPVSSTTSGKTIETLRTLFSCHGIPEDLVSDNGPQFTSDEFAQFIKMNGIRHISTSPYHPASNGSAERGVQTVKQALVKQVPEASIKDQRLTLSHRLANFLLIYRATPHTVTGVPPAELFLKRQLRTRFSLLKPDLGKTVERRQEEQVRQHDAGRVQFREFLKGQTVRVRNFRGGKERWIPGVIVKKLGIRTFLARVGGRVRFVHVDHLLPAVDTETVDKANGRHEFVEVPAKCIPIPTSVCQNPPTVRETTSESFTSPEVAPIVGTDSSVNTEVSSPAERRYPMRNRKVPQRLDL